MTTREQREKEIAEKVTPTVGNHECDWWWNYGGLVSYLADLEERIDSLYSILTPSQRIQMEENRKIAGKNTEGVI